MERRSRMDFEGNKKVGGKRTVNKKFSPRGPKNSDLLIISMGSRSSTAHGAAIDPTLARLAATNSIPIHHHEDKESLKQLRKSDESVKPIILCFYDTCNRHEHPA